MFFLFPQHTSLFPRVALFCYLFRVALSDKDRFHHLNDGRAQQTVIPALPHRTTQSDPRLAQGASIHRLWHYQRFTPSAYGQRIQEFSRFPLIFYLFLFFCFFVFWHNDSPG